MKDRQIQKASSLQQNKLSKEDDILIVEDSPATTMLIKDFLKSLGYENIHSCDHGQLAITTFRQLVEANKEPIVLLDFVLPDMDARSIMTQILEISPSVKVILITATEKSDVGVKELIRQGIYQYVEKPLRFERLKQVFETLEKEKKFFEKESQQKDLLKEGIDKKHEQIDFLLRSYGQISQNMVQELSGTSKESLNEHLHELEEQRKIMRVGELKEVTCNQCNSVKVMQMFFCPSCQKTNFNKSRLVEHFDCGNFSPEKDYKNNICPKCKKELKALGVDYRIIKDRYVCNNCEDIFQEMSSRFLCLKCNNRFALEDAEWQTSSCYKALDSTF